MKNNKQQSESLVELNIEAIGFEGISIAKHEGQVFFVKGGVPGDKVIAAIKSKHKAHTECTIKEILVPSSSRCRPFCEYFGTCGGCSWQCLDYKQQLHWKRQHIIDAYQHIAKIDIESHKYHNTMSAGQILHYRNKMDFSFSSWRWFVAPPPSETTDRVQGNRRNFALGLHTPGSFDKVIDITECKIQAPIWDAILAAVREKALELNVAPYTHRANKGFLKGLTLRQSRQTGEIMCILTTHSFAEKNSEQFENEKTFIAWFRYELKAQFPIVVSFTHCINTQNSVNTGEIQFIEGKNYITERILGVEYHISPFSFFQTNSYQLDTFIKLILDTAAINNHDIVWDLYCGTGSITLPAASLCSKIYGVELNDIAITDAKKNANLNNITNAAFYAADLHSKKTTLLEQFPQPDIIIIDPPRSGLHPGVIKTILNVQPKRLIYVSCNPATQARDLIELTTKYEILNVHSIDMFPHTYHIEVITELQLLSETKS